MAKKSEPTVRESKKQFTVYLRPETHHALLRLALDHSSAKGTHVSASQIVEQLIERHVKKEGRHA